MARECVFEHPQGARWRSLLVGNRLVSIASAPAGRGENRTVQRFPSIAAAEEHAAMIAGMRRREGYVLVSDTVVDDSSAGIYADAPEWLDWDAQSERAVATLDDGVRVSAKQIAAMIDVLARSPVRELRLDCDGKRLGDALAVALAHSPLPTLSRLSVGSSDADPQRANLTHVDRIDDTIAALPELEVARFAGDLRTGPIMHAKLQHLELAGSPLRPAALDALHTSELQALQTLVLSSTSTRGRTDAGAEAMARCLSAMSAPLRVVGVEIDDGELAPFLRVLGAALPPTLHELAVWMRVDDEPAVVSALATWPRTDLALRLPLDELSAETEQQIRVRFRDLGPSHERLAELKAFH